MEQLLDRTAFRELALQRDGHCCVICGRNDGLSVHHILERKLWPDGGYYLLNAASLCEQHHLQAELTQLTVEQVREAAGIREVIVPPRLDEAKIYDKWGNLQREDGVRIQGPLFCDDGCQRALKAARVFHLYQPAA
jgi:hypothetical protein